MELIDKEELRKVFWRGVEEGDICSFADTDDIVKNAPTVEAVVLPCKLGAPVFVIGGKYRHGRVEKWINPGEFRLSDLEKMGKTVFLTQEEAEGALEEMEV